MIHRRRIHTVCLLTWGQEVASKPFHLTFEAAIPSLLLIWCKFRVVS